MNRVGQAFACLGGSSRSVLLNVSYYKKHEYIWLRGGDLKGFRDIKPFILSLLLF